MFKGLTLLPHVKNEQEKTPRGGAFFGLKQGDSGVYSFGASNVRFDEGPSFSSAKMAAPLALKAICCSTLSNSSVSREPAIVFKVMSTTP